MNCPKCLTPMKVVTFREVAVDRCNRCGGLYFDPLELDRLLSLDGSEALDTGDAAAGHELDKVPVVHCPRCLERGVSARMIFMVDADQPHLHFDRCPVCGGAFLDAGEFYDLKRHAGAGDSPVRGAQEPERHRMEP